MGKNHLDKFQGQCSTLVSQKTYDRRMDGKDSIGYPADEDNLNGSMFVSTSDDIDRALSACNGDISKLEESLGFPQGHLGDGPIVRVDINNPEEHGLRMANGREPGANEYYNTPLDENGNLPDIKYVDTDRKIVDTAKTDPDELAKLNGQYWDQNGCYHPPNTEGYQGKTSGGLDEAVVNQIPNTPQNISYTRYEGFKRNENSELSSCKLTDGYSPDSYKFNSDTSNENVVEKDIGFKSSSRGHLPTAEDSPPDKPTVIRGHTDNELPVSSNNTSQSVLRGNTDNLADNVIQTNSQSNIMDRSIEAADTLTPKPTGLGQ